MAGINLCVLVILVVSNNVIERAKPQPDSEVVSDRAECSHFSGSGPNPFTFNARHRTDPHLILTVPARHGKTEPGSTIQTTRLTTGLRKAHNPSTRKTLRRSSSYGMQVDGWRISLATVRRKTPRRKSHLDSMNNYHAHYKTNSSERRSAVVSHHSTNSPTAIQLQRPNQDLKRNRRDVIKEKTPMDGSRSQPDDHELERVTSSLYPGTQKETDENRTVNSSDDLNASIKNKENVSEIIVCDVIQPNSKSSNLTKETNDTGHSVVCPESLTEPKIYKIWQKGALSFGQFNRIRTGMRWASIIIAIPGLPLAALSAKTFTSKRMKNRVSDLVVTFNVCEGLKTTWIISLRLWRQLLGDSLITWSSLYTYVFMFASTWVPTCFGRISLLANMLVSIDRFVKLVFPLKSFTWKVIAYPKLAVAMCVVLPVTVNSSFLFLILAYIIPNVDRSRKFTADEIASLIALTNPKVFVTYEKILTASSICFRYIPLAISLTLSIIAVVSIFHKQRNFRLLSGQQTAPTRSSTNSPRLRIHQNQTQQNNTMIVTSILLFSLLASLKPLVRVLGTLHPTIGEGKQDLYIYLILNELAVFVDNLVPILNFVTYFSLSSYFRMSLRDMLKKPT